MSDFNPLFEYSEIVLTLTRIFVGIVMLYFGLPKIKDLSTNAQNFVDMGFKPGWFWGTIVAILESVGGVLMILGLLVAPIAIFFGIQMFTGTIWKITKAKKKFPDYSYDMLLLTLCLILITIGSGISIF